MSYSTIWQNQGISSHIEDESAKPRSIADATDQQLVELILAGEKKAFEQLFERYKRLVASVAVYYFQRPEQVEEIIQITFAKVYFELKNFNGKYDYSLAGWLKRITANVCIDTLRKNKRKPENLSCEFAETENESLFTDSKKTIEEILSEKDLANKLLSHVSPEDQAVLRMFYGEGMNVSEISEITGWSKSKIKTRTCRARKALRKIIKKYL